METKTPLDSSKAQSVNELVVPTAEAGAADAPEIEVLLQSCDASVSETPFTIDEKSSNVTNKSSTPPRDVSIFLSLTELILQEVKEWNIITGLGFHDPIFLLKRLEDLNCFLEVLALYKIHSLANFYLIFNGW